MFNNLIISVAIYVLKIIITSDFRFQKYFDRLLAAILHSVAWLLHEREVKVLILDVFDSWSLFYKISFSKKSHENCSLGSPKFTVRLKSRENKIVITLNCNNYWISNDKSLIISAIKKNLKNINHDKKFTSKIVYP